MNATELAQLFVNYAEAQKQLDAMRVQIEAAVLDLGESQKIAGVKATYYNPTIETDYEAAARAHGAPQSLIKMHSTTKVTTAWKAVAEEAGADLSAYQTTKPARVVVK